MFENKALPNDPSGAEPFETALGKANGPKNEGGNTGGRLNEPTEKNSALRSAPGRNGWRAYTGESGKCKGRHLIDELKPVDEREDKFTFDRVFKAIRKIMYMAKKFIALTLSLFAISGCGIHPLPEDVAQLNTQKIALQIRCEARDAIKNAIADFLLNEKINISPLDRAVGMRLRDGMPFAEFKPSHLTDYTRRYVEKYENAAIAYDFEFDMTASNNNSANVTLVGGILSIVPSVKDDLERQTVRTFRLADTFAALRSANRCDHNLASGPNYQYPITGQIGLGEFVKTFIDLNEINNLTGKEDNDSVRRITDTFRFSTILEAGVNSTATRKTDSLRWHLAAANLNVSSKRTDIHKVTVAISFDEKKAPNFVRTNPLSPVPGVAIVGRNKMSAKESAFEAIDNQKFLQSLNNLNIRNR